MAGAGMTGIHRPDAQTVVWLTPPEILAALGAFDLDPCAVSEPRPWPTARRMIALPENGLAAPWHGHVWCNPPYGREAAAWLARLADHGRGTALIFARTETEMFFAHVWGRATAILFLEGRLHFHRPDGSRAETNSGAPSCLVAYGVDDAIALIESGLRGQFLCLQ
jgi:hypothetical protein